MGEVISIWDVQKEEWKNYQCDDHIQVVSPERNPK
jgi:hypothetical protein